MASDSFRICHDQVMSMLSELSSLLRRPSGLPTSPTGYERRPPPENDEIGEWMYIVVDPKGIALRSEPSYNKDERPRNSCATKLREGELVRVVERRPLAHSTTCWLRLAEGGWCVDIHVGPKGDSQDCLLEVQVEEHNRVYRVIAKKGVG